MASLSLNVLLITQHGLAFGDLIRAPIAWKHSTRPLRRGGLHTPLLVRGMGSLQWQGRHQLNCAFPVVRWRP